MRELEKWYPIKNEQEKVAFIDLYFDKLLSCLKEIKGLENSINFLQETDKNNLSVDDLNEVLEIIKVNSIIARMKKNTCIYTFIPYITFFVGIILGVLLGRFF